MAQFLTVYETAVTGIPLFGRVHLGWLLFAAVFFSGSTVAYRRCGIRGRRRWRRGIAAAQILGELGKYAVVLAAGYPDVQYLPLHLCSLCMFASIAYAIRPSAEAGEFLFAAGLPGAAAALLFPGWTVLPAGSYLSIHSFLFHILLLSSVLLPLSAGEIRPDVRRLPGCALVIVAASPPVYAVNHRFGTNFFYLALPGEGNPLSLFAQLWGNPGYVAVLPLLCGSVWAVLYGGIALSRRIYFDNHQITIDKI